MEEPNQPAVALADRAVRFEERSAIKRLGLIALATDLTSERDFARLVPADRAAVHTTRVAYDNPTTPDNLRKMAPNLTAAADLLLPGEALAAICYSCTAASVVIGDEVVTLAIQAARPGVPVVTPTGAARLAFAALGIARIAILTPYLVETSSPMAAYFSRHGIAVTRLDCFGLEDDRDMARVCRKDIVEARIGKPVVTSNQASIWAMLRHAGLDDVPPGHGRLFDFDLPSRDRGMVA